MPPLGVGGGEAKVCFGILGSGEFIGLSPGRGLIGRPGVSTGGERMLR